MHKIGNIQIEKGVPWIEARGRPTSAEYLTLLETRVGESFVSRKSRHTLYAIARNQRTVVKITSAGEQGWRVYKMSEKMTPVQWDLYQYERRQKALMRKAKKRYSAAHGREKEVDQWRDQTSRQFTRSAKS